MPASAQTISGIVYQLNEVNTKRGIYQNYDTASFLMDVLDKGDQGNKKLASMLAEVDGRFVAMHTTTTGNPNTMISVPEGTSYPDMGSQSTIPIKYKCERFISALGMTSEVLSRSANDRQSIMRVHAREMEMLMKQNRRKTNSYLLGDGSGCIAVVAGSGNNWNDTTKKLTVPNAALFEVGMDIIPRALTTGNYIGDATHAAGASGWTFSELGEPYPLRVSARDIANKTITLTYWNGTAYGTNSASLTAFNGAGLYFWNMQGRAMYGIKNMCATTNPSRSGFNPSSVPADPDNRNMTRAFGSIDRTATTDWQALAAKDVGSRQVTVKEDLEPLEAQITSVDSELYMDTGSVIALSDQVRWQGITHELESGRRTATRKRIADNRYDVVESGIFLFAFDPQVESYLDANGLNVSDFFFFPPKYIFHLILTAWQMELHDGVSKTQVAGSFGRLTSKWQQNLETERQFVVNRCNSSSQFNNCA